MKIPITQPIQIDSFYKEFNEPETGNDAEVVTKCEMYDCPNDAMVVIHWPVPEMGTIRREYLCMECYAAPAYQELVAKYKPKRYKI